MKQIKKGYSLIELLIVLGIIAMVGVLIFFTYSKLSSERKINESVKDLNYLQSQLDIKNYADLSEYFFEDGQMGFFYDMQKNQILKAEGSGERRSNVVSFNVDPKTGNYTISMSSTTQSADTTTPQVCARFLYQQYLKDEFKTISTINGNIDNNLPNSNKEKYQLSKFMKDCNNDMKFPFFLITY